jgi:hypothetical protein
MAHTEHHGVHHAHDAPPGYETTDASLGGVERFMIITGLFLAACFGLVWLMFVSLGSRETALDVKPSPVVPRPGDRLPPLPRLQTLPGDDLGAFRRSEAAALESWAWVDRAGGIVQVPIARAIEILAERGLPVPPPSAAPAAVPPAAPGAPTTAPGASIRP